VTDLLIERWVIHTAGAMGKMWNCGMRKVKMWNQKKNNADWSRRLTTWLLAFRRLPHQSLNWQCSKMQTRNAEKLSNGGRYRFLTTNPLCSTDL